MTREIFHYGVPRRSGRYPWGSGEDPQRSRSFVQEVKDLKKKGIPEKQIAEGMGMSIAQLRARTSLAKNEIRKSDYNEALRLSKKGMSNVEIGKRMGKNESSIRSLLDPAIQQRLEITNSTANMLKDAVKKKKYVDIGIGVEHHIGISRTRLKTAVAKLQEEGYTVHYLNVEQLGTGKKTSLIVLANPGVTSKEVFKNKDKIALISEHTEDGGRSWLGLEPIKNVSSNRVHIRYAEDGGTDKDGIIELRRGVKDLSLGNVRYAQVRIGVDGTHFLKGMAMYSDDMPKGKDIIYNTNKKSDTPKEKVFKEMKDDPDNPFGAVIKPGGQKGALNIVNEEGDWGKWSRTLSSQVLSKQSPSLAKKQLELAYNAKKEEFDELMSLTNPAVKKFLLAGSDNLSGFAADCDAAAVHLKAAALPRQGAHVILPFPTMKENQIYAPKYNNGETVVLIRYPHGGKFEIPELVVNNKHAEARKIIGSDAKDAVGIHPKVAERLSGADFDGDTVLVIPNPKGANAKGAIKTMAPLKDLENFDPKDYKLPEDAPRMSSSTKGMQMGLVSNLITDMTIKGAPPDELARAVRHSMVVIDAEKHHLDYKQSYIDNGIAALNLKYQGKSGGGASTLISRASSDKRVGIRKESVDPKTGKKMYEYTGETYINKKGEQTLKLQKSSKMYETDDAFTLSSGTPMETTYATHANKLKALGNEARKAAINTPPISQSRSAKETYSKEVASLKAQLNLALKNKPLERRAQILANTVVAMKKKANPDMDGEDLKKIKGQALTEARVRVGAKKQQIEISDKEWEAIQSGAISNNVLTQILNNTNLDRVRQLATPRTTKMLTSTKLARAKQMLNSGYTQAEVAAQLGVSTSLLIKSIE